MEFPLWVKVLFWGGLVSGVALFGWKANGWRLEAARAGQLDAQLTAERTAHQQSEAARIKFSADLAAAEGKTRVEIREVIRKVPQIIHDNRVCDLSDETVSQLNHVRGYDGK